MEGDLVASGRFVRIETVGRRSGQLRAVTVGFVDDVAGPAGAVFVAAGAPDSAWALNLFDEPLCRFMIGERVFDAVAEPLEAADHARAIAAMILRYGTPAESLGIGPTFRLRPTSEATS
jgi:deazaflavin-dependent oxidoreductase (nitroreductase family)